MLVTLPSAATLPLQSVGKLGGVKLVVTQVRSNPAGAVTLPERWTSSKRSNSWRLTGEVICTVGGAAGTTESVNTRWSTLTRRGVPPTPTVRMALTTSLWSDEALTGVLIGLKVSLPSWTSPLVPTAVPVELKRTSVTLSPNSASAVSSSSPTCQLTDPTGFSN